MQPVTSRIAIIGNGIVGLLTALSLREHGHDVVVIDPHRPGSIEGMASYGNAGVVSPWSCVPQCLPGTWKQVPGWLLDRHGPVRVRWPHLPTLLPWAWRFLSNCSTGRVDRIADAMDVLMQGNVSAYRRYLQHTDHQDLIQNSWYLNVYRGNDRPNADDLPWTLRRARGASIEFIDRSELLEIEPAIGPDYHSAVIIKDQSRLRSPGLLCEVLGEQAKQSGVSFIRASVTRIVPESATGAILELTDAAVRDNARAEPGRLEADRIVLCAGIGSTKLLAPLGYRLPLMSERGYHLEFLNPGVTLTHSIQDMAGKFVVSSMLGGVRTAGTAEFAPPDAAPDYGRAEIFRELTRRLLPDLNTHEARPWMGVRPSFPDNLPAIGALQSHPSIIAAFGHSHYGMGMAPATARLVSGIINGTPSNIDMSPYRPERFH